MAAGCTSESKSLGQPAGPRPTQGVHTDSSKGLLPGYDGLTSAQKLDRALSLPGMRGVVRGVTGLPPSPYPVGSTITLRVGGGTLGATTEVVADAPSVEPGQYLFVSVHGQGNNFGGNTPAVLVASDKADVLQVASGVVHWHGVDDQFAEPVATFRQHFVRNSASPTPRSTP